MNTPPEQVLDNGLAYDLALNEDPYREIAVYAEKRGKHRIAELALQEAFRINHALEQDWKSQEISSDPESPRLEFSDKEDFRNFATRCGYATVMADRAWKCLSHGTAMNNLALDYETRPDEALTVDLTTKLYSGLAVTEYAKQLSGLTTHSIYSLMTEVNQRIAIDGSLTPAELLHYDKAGAGTVRFLTDYVNTNISEDLEPIVHAC